MDPMPSTKLVLGGAGAVALLAARAVRVLHARRPDPVPEPAPQPRQRTPDETLATALAESADAGPELDEGELLRLRRELRRELQRLAAG